MNSDLANLDAAQAFVQDSSAASEPWVQACLDAASQSVADFLGADPTSQTRTELFSGANTGFIYPRARGRTAPITGVTSININPALNDPGCGSGWWGFGIGNYSPAVPTPIAIDPSVIAFTADSIYLANGQKFPRGKKNLTLVYTSGYALDETQGVPLMPSAIVQATLYVTKGFFTALGKELNATGESYSGVMSQSFFPTGAGAIPPAARMLLMPYQCKMFSP